MARMKEADGVNSPTGSGRGQLLLVVLMTLLAAGAGYGVGLLIAPSDDLTQVQETDPAGAAENAPPVTSDKQSRVTNPTVVDLPPIITGIAHPPDTWMRLELSVLFDGAPGQSLAGEIAQDFLAYVRTVSLDEVAGPSGFLHLRTELARRAADRSGGQATDILVKVMLFE